MNNLKLCLLYLAIIVASVALYLYVDFGLYTDILVHINNLARGNRRVPRADEINLLHADHLQHLGQSLGRSLVRKPNLKLIKSSSMYVVGLIQGLTLTYIKSVSWNLALLMSLTSSGTALIYADEASERLLNELKDDRIIIIAESKYPLQGSSRTTRLAFGRNLLLQKARDLAASRKEDLAHSFLSVIDPDNASAGKFSEKVLRSAMKSTSAWDVLSFNRHKGGYYDIWALRYRPFDFNLWVQDDPWGLLKNVTADIESRLLQNNNNNSTNEEQFYPVLSAFNGIAIYKMNFTVGCAYDGVPRSRGTNDLKDANGADDCEHVSFHKCMISRNGARIMIDKKAIS